LSAEQACIAQDLLERPGDMRGPAAIDAYVAVLAFQVVYPDFDGGDAAVVVAADGA
jgi:hypothetical protein